MVYNLPMPLRIVIAPQAFKQSISARAAAIAIQNGVRRAVPEAETVLIPVADGGDGTLAALIDTTGGRYFTAQVTGPLGDAIPAQWGVMGDGETAVIEMALASGLALIPDHRRDPRTATTYGTGETGSFTLTMVTVGDALPGVAVSHADMDPAAPVRIGTAIPVAAAFTKTVTGFTVEDIREPTPTAEQAARYPIVSDNLRVPEFIIYILRKPW